MSTKYHIQGYLLRNRLSPYTSLVAWVHMRMLRRPLKTPGMPCRLKTPQVSCNLSEAILKVRGDIIWHR